MRTSRRRTGCSCLLLTCLITLPSTASAQKAFVDGGALIDYDPTLRSDTSTTLGGSVAAGTFLTSRTSVRLEFDLPAWHGSDFSGQARVLQRIEKYQSHEDNRAPSVSVLVGRDVRRDARVRVTVLGGATVTTRASRREGRTEYYDLDGTFIERRLYSDSSDGHQWLAFTFGTDVVVPVRPRLQLVPQVRLHSYLFSEHTAEVFVRPRVMMRWQF